MNDSPPPPPAARTPVMLWLILALAILAAAAPFLLVSRAKEIVTWRSDVEAVFADARATGKPVLIDFTADWCPPCKVMKREVFSKERVKAALERDFVPLRIDVTQRSSESERLGTRFNVKYLPTYLVVAPDGQELRREVGFLDEEKFLAWARQ